MNASNYKNYMEANKKVVDAASVVVQTLLNETTLHRATLYIEGQLVVKATRHNRYDGRNNNETFNVTYGRPNFAERVFIKKCKAAGEPFPIRKVQLKFYPAKQRKAA